MSDASVDPFAFWYPSPASDGLMSWAPCFAPLRQRLSFNIRPLSEILGESPEVRFECETQPRP